MHVCVSVVHTLRLRNRRLHMCVVVVHTLRLRLHGCVFAVNACRNRC